MPDSDCQVPLADPLIDPLRDPLIDCIMDPITGLPAENPASDWKS